MPIGAGVNPRGHSESDQKKEGGRCSSHPLGLRLTPLPGAISSLERIVFVANWQPELNDLVAVPAGVLLEELPVRAR